MTKEEKTNIVDNTCTGDIVDNKHVGYTVDDIDFVLRQFALEEKEKTEKDKGYKGKTGLAIIVGEDEEVDMAIIFGNKFKDIVNDLSAIVRDHKSIHDIFMAVIVNCARKGYIDAEIYEELAAENDVSKQTMS